MAQKENSIREKGFFFDTKKGKKHKDLEHYNLNFSLLAKAPAAFVDMFRNYHLTTLSLFFFSF